MSRQAKYSAEKAQRLEVRLKIDQKELIQKAAEIQGCSITDFVLNCLQVEASKILREHQVITLNAKETSAFVDALLHPDAPNEALQTAFSRYQQLKQETQ